MVRITVFPVIFGASLVSAYCWILQPSQIFPRSGGDPREKGAWEPFPGAGIQSKGGRRGEEEEGGECWQV